MSEPNSSHNAAPSPVPEHEPTLLEQMGGLTGLVSATLPVVVLIPINNIWGLGPALAAAVGVAVIITIWRLIRKETLQPAISGLLGVAICAGIAWYTGSAKGYFLYGIWMSLVLCILALISIAVRWPAVGLIWKGINGEDMRWRTVTAARRAYAWATAGWAVIFLARFVIQRALYDADSTTTLGVVRILMGWPLTGVVTILTVWMVRRADKVMDELYPATADAPDTAAIAESDGGEQ